MRVWQVVPLSRPHEAARVVREFSKQTWSDRKLCLVCNGPAREAQVDADLVIRTGDGGKPEALNAAMDALRGEVVAIRDDDDVSLPQDLATCSEAFVRTGATIVSRLRHWVELRGRLWLFAEDHGEAPGESNVWGGSLMFRVTGDIPEFPSEQVTESQSWVRQMLTLGADVWRPSIYHQIHRRDGDDKMWRAGELEARRTLGLKLPGRRYAIGAPALELASGRISRDAYPSEWVTPPNAIDVFEEIYAAR